MTLREKIRSSFMEGLDGVVVTIAEENELYAQVTAELKDDIRDEGLWGRALAKGGSNPEGTYIEYRFQILRADLVRKKEYLQKKYKEEQEAIAAKEEAERIAIQKVKKEADKKLREKEAWIQFSVFILLIGVIIFGARLV